MEGDPVDEMPREASGGKESQDNEWKVDREWEWVSNVHSRELT